MNITIAICTKLRAELKTCLDSLAREENQDFVLMVVINSDQEASFEHSRVDHFYVEKTPGLSRARNLAVRKCSTKYLCFVDDDAYVEPGFVEELSNTIQENEFAAFGGRYIPWYKYGKPKWYSDKWASSKTFRGDIGILEKGYFPGGVSCWDVEAVRGAGGFPEDLGMNAQKISYGEEVWIQKKLRDSGNILGYNPDLMIRHLVPKEKLSANWLWRSSFAKGRDSWQFQMERKSGFLFLKIALKAVLGFIINLLNELSCFLRRKTLYFKTALINAALPFAYALGRLSAFFK